MYIHRPATGYLALYQGEDGDKLLTYGIPDAEFWAWCDAKGYTAQMEHDDPKRMARVRKIGVYPLHPYAYLGKDYPTPAALISKRPANIDPITGERPIEITAEATPAPREVER